MTQLGFQMRFWMIIQICLVAMVSGATSIRDPNLVLPNIRNFVGQQPFAEAFHCGDTSFLRAFRISCEYQADTDWISSTCKDIPQGLPVQRQVVTCTEDSVTVYIDATGESVTLSAAEYASAGFNVAELFLETLPQFMGYDSAYLTLTSAESSTYTLGRGTASERQVPSMNIRGLLREPDKRGLDILVSVIRNAVGVAQVARLRADSYSWFLLEDFATGKSK